MAFLGRGFNSLRFHQKKTSTLWQVYFVNRKPLTVVFFSYRPNALTLVRGRYSRAKIFPTEVANMLKYNTSTLWQVYFVNRKPLTVVFFSYRPNALTLVRGRYSRAKIFPTEVANMLKYNTSTLWQVWYKY